MPHESPTKPLTDTAAPSVDRNWALFLDLDGTLLDIASTPDAAVVPEGLLDLLAGLHGALGNAVALISGRSITTLDALLAPLRLPAAGQHGAEIRDRHGAEIVPLYNRSLDAKLIQRLRDFARERPGIVVECKGASAAIHYRNAPRYKDEIGRLLAELLDDQEDFALLSSRMAFDIKPQVVHKGTAIDWLMGRPPFLGRIPVFAGDDRTDEDGFAAVSRLGGYAIGVGDHVSAKYHLSSPETCRDWLAASLAILDGR